MPSEESQSRIGRAKLAVIVAGAIATAYIVGWTRGYDRGLGDAVSTETGAVGLEPLPEAAQQAWVTPVVTVSMVAIMFVIVVWGVRGGFPRRV